MASGAEFKYNLVDDSFQQLWSNTVYWTLESGTDDGLNGYPDGTDTFIMDRSSTISPSTRLAIEGGPPFEVGGITGKGGPDRDIVLKFGDFTLGDLEVQESADSFLILSERDKNFTITGVISGSGDLVLQRLGGFSDGVDPDELTTITGTSPNTITGTIRLFNSSNAQPSYWVADKVGAFGQAPSLTLEGAAGASEVSSLRITANALGGEGAIDDDATTLFIGNQGVLSLDAGVDEKVGEGKLFIDPDGTGTYTEVPLGTYNNSEPWIIGEGTVTVGAGSSLDFTITEINYLPDAVEPTVTLTWTSSPGKGYAVTYSTDMVNWDSDLDDGVVGDEGETTTREFDLSEFPQLISEAKVFFRVEEL
jgi:hypothetical protein